MVGKFSPSEEFIMKFFLNHKNYPSNATNESNDIENEVATKLLNIARTFQATPMATPTTLKCHSSPISRYFVKVHIALLP
jgi:hypothetical protein